MMTGKAIIGGFQNALNLHLSPQFMLSASVRSRSIATEPTTPQASNDALPSDDAIDVFAPNVPEVDDTAGQATPIKPFDCSN